MDFAGMRLSTERKPSEGYRVPDGRVSRTFPRAMRILKMRIGWRA